MANLKNHSLSLGLDIGTSGVRGICIDNQQMIQASASVAIKETHRTALRNPLNWKTMLTQVFAELSKQIKLERITSISVDGQSGTVLLCDTEGKPIGNTSLLYNDAPSKETCHDLKERIGSCPATLGRVYKLWKHSGQPKDFHIVHQADWIAGIFCNCFTQSDENNALKMGYSPALKNWGFSIGKLPFESSSLPTVRVPSEIMGFANSHFAKEIGLSTYCRIVSGTTDGTAGFVAASGLQTLAAGTAVTSLGTTLVIKILSKDNIESPKFGVYSHKLMNVWIAGGASNSGAGVLLNFFTPEQMNELSKQIDPAVPSPLKYYPLLVKGERFPVNDLQKESLVEPRPENDAEFLAGLFESIAHIEKQAYETLDKLGALYPKEVKTVGGGSYNDVWTKIRARVLGVKVVTAEQPSAAYGSALIAQFGCMRADATSKNI